MTKYFVYDNASRRIQSNGFEFAFDQVEQFGGSWRGVLKLEDPAAIKELATLADRLGIEEITIEQFDAYIKKKTRSRGSLEISASPPLSSPIKVGVNPAQVKTPIGKVTSGVELPTAEETVTGLVGKTAPYVDPLVSGKKRGKNVS